MSGEHYFICRVALMAFAVCVFGSAFAFDPAPVNRFVDHVNEVVTNRTVVDEISAALEDAVGTTTNGFIRAESNMCAKTSYGWSATTSTTGRAWHRTRNWTTNTTHKIHRKMEPFRAATTNLFSSASAPVRPLGA